MQLSLYSGELIIFELFVQFQFLYFVGGCEWNFGDEYYVIWNLLFGDFVFEEFEYFFVCEFYVRFFYYYQQWVFVLFWVMVCDVCGYVYVGVCSGYVFYIDG